MDKNKTLDNIHKTKDIINNINNLFSDVDKGIVALDENLKDSKKVDDKESAIGLYKTHKDNFKKFLDKLNSKVSDIEKSLDVQNNKNDKDVKNDKEKKEVVNPKDEDIKAENKKEGK